MDNYIKSELKELINSFKDDKQLNKFGVELSKNEIITQKANLGGKKQQSKRDIIIETIENISSNREKQVLQSIIKINDEDKVKLEKERRLFLFIILIMIAISFIVSLIGITLLMKHLINLDDLKGIGSLLSGFIGTNGVVFVFYLRDDKRLKKINEDNQRAQNVNTYIVLRDSLSEGEFSRIQEYLFRK